MTIVPGTPVTVINTTATASSYTATVPFTVAGAGELLVICLQGLKGSNTPAPSSVPLDVKWNGIAAAFVVEQDSSTLTEWSAIYTIENPTPGTGNVTVDGLTMRCLSAAAQSFTGWDTGGSIVASGGSQTGSSATSLSFSRTPAAAGNYLLSSYIHSSRDITAELTGTGGVTPTNIGVTSGSFTNANDHTFAIAGEIVPDTSANGHGYAWTTGGRGRLTWVEIAAGVAPSGQTLIAGAGTFTLTGQPANLKANRKLLAGAGTFALTGQDAILSSDSVFLAGVGTFALTGQPAILRANRRLLAGAGSFALTGQDATLSNAAGGVTQALAITPVLCDGYVFDSADNLVAAVTIKGVGTTGDSIQVRGASVGGNTSWHATTVDVLGNWTITFDVPLAEWGNWYGPEARIGTDDGTKVTSSNLFGCGNADLVIAQSEAEYTLNPTSFYSSGVTMPTLKAPNVTILTQPTGGGITPRRITAATLGQVNVAMVSLANALSVAAPDRKFMIVDGAVPGTGRAQLMNDANTGRDWSELQGIVDYVRSGGSDIGAVLEIWHTNDAPTLINFATEWSPLYMGQRWGGGAFTLGTANPDSTANPSAPVDHCLWDVTAPSDQLGRGLFARDRTKYYMMTPVPYTDASTGTEQNNFSVGGGARIAQVDRPMRDNLKAFFDDSRVQTFGGGWGPSMHILATDGHPLTSSRWGVAQMGLNYLPSVLRAAGVAVGEPVITGTFTASDGSYADVIVSLPNGGDLTTIRALNSIAAPGTEPPHYQPVVGLEIRRAADADTARRPVYKTSETTYPINYRGTVTIADAGSGSGPGRTGRIRVTPTTPFVTGDRLEFLRGEATAATLDPRDTTAQLFMDMPIENVPAFYDATTLYPYQGVPVRPQPALMTLTLAPPGQTLTAGAGAFALAGQPATLRANRRLVAGAGSFALAGQPANLKAGLTLAAAAGTFTLTGQPAVLRANRRLVAAAGVFALTGQPATLVSSGAPTLSARWASANGRPNGGLVLQGNSQRGQFTLNQNDTRPAWREYLSPAIDLAGASVKLVMRERSTGLTVIDAAATIVTPSTLGGFQYDWTLADTANAGIFDAQFQITYADGGIESFPNGGGYFEVLIQGDIG